MSRYCKQYATALRLIALCCAILLPVILVPEGNAQKQNFVNYQKVIVIDPGHGGHERGAKGPERTLEKTVSFNLARIIAVELSNTYKVILTRTDDYWLDLPSRTATANHKSADLFISIHAGGSFHHQARGMTLYYFKEPLGPTLAQTTELLKPLTYTTQIPWEKIQTRHKTTSSVLAKLIRKRINEQVIFIKSNVQGAPLMVLEGADMPAVVIEIGYITNPAEEKALRDINVLSKIAKGIHNAVDEFFQKVR
jgi:N-acetylmuramoyl-L-alanine amidase